jgi:hypothetical protein
MHPYNPSAQEAETGVQGLPGLHSENLSTKQKKKKRREGGIEEGRKERKGEREVRHMYIKKKYSVRTIH